MADFDDEKQKKQLEDWRRLEEEQVVSALAESKYGIPYIDLYHQIVENEALRAIPEEEAHALGVAPFKLSGSNILIAVRSPQPEILERLKKEMLLQSLAPSFYMVSEASLKKVWERYEELSMAKSSQVGGVEISAEVLRETAKNIQKMKDISVTIEATLKENQPHKISRILEIILAGAIAIRASDIHIEPEKGRGRLRLRLDGILQDITFFETHIYELLNSRIKLLSGMKLTSKISQDGRFSIMEGTDEINIRSSMIPGTYGESIVMRILDPKAIQVAFEELGIEPYLLRIVEAEIARPNGLILVTGPTGSGKTTTLYAFLRKIYTPEINVITIEDPVEYHIGGITQTQVDEKSGNLTFLEGLRSSLRHDPDVIMVGEIRDGETAKTAVQAALTGHLVLSTLHTNNAAGAIPRLIELGADPKILPSALTLSMAQRLVRKLCKFCKRESTADSEARKVIESILDKMKKDGKELLKYGIEEKNLVFYEPVGCDKCNSTGYSGRVGVFEAIKTDEAIEKITAGKPSEREIRKIAAAQGILTMREDAMIKILSGVTSFAEVKNVVDISEE